MILLHNVVEILDLADGDRGAVLGIVALDGSFIGRTPVDGDLLRHAVAADRFLERLLLDSRVVDVTMAYTPTFVTLSSLKPFFFNGLQNE